MTGNPVRILICTDLDRTLLPNGAAPESPPARPRFAALAQRPEVTLAYVTGRHRDLVQAAIAEFAIPTPDFVISDVGSTIFRVRDGVWSSWDAWAASIAEDWEGRPRGELARLLEGQPQLRLQEPEKQGIFKLSYYTPEDWDRASLLPAIEERLRDEGIRPSLIWSLDETTGTGLLDVLPARATKRHAIEFLMEQEGFPERDTVCAGDSGNDLPVLTSHLQAVLVANATDEVRAEALAEAEAQETIETLYLARGGFKEMNGNYAAGILEGLAHYIPASADMYG
jgi:HAD superfamily hydrolase (TIGR01484 family)